MKKLKKKPRNGLVAALDVGTTKIACFVAKVDDGVPRVVGIGHQVSAGVRAGTIVDMEGAESAILTAISAAEQMAGETLQSVVVNVSGGYPTSRTVTVEVSIAGHEIGDTDLRRVVDQGRHAHAQTDRRLLHAIPVSFTIDGSRGFRDPRGIDFPNLLSMIQMSFMSRANSIVIPGGRRDIAMQLILTPLILTLVERKRRAS